MASLRSIQRVICQKIKPLRLTRFKQDEVAQKKRYRKQLSFPTCEQKILTRYSILAAMVPCGILQKVLFQSLLLESFYNSGKPIALVCHSPGVLHRVTYKGEPLVKGKRVTGFANSEEEEVQLTKIVPFLVEDELKRLGGLYEKAPNWQSFVIVDGRLITGQNPASSTAAAQEALGSCTK